MRPESTELVRHFHQVYKFPEPIVDIGGAETNRQFSSIFDYKVWDIRAGSDVDLVVDVRNMVSSGKIAPGSIGTVLSWDALEHVFEIFDAVSEIGKAVRPGGFVAIGVPWVYRMHDPNGDYWRFSTMALTKLFKNVGFMALDVDYWDSNNGTYYVGRKV